MDLRLDTSPWCSIPYLSPMYTCIRTWTYHMYTPLLLLVIPVQASLSLLTALWIYRATFVIYLWGLVLLRQNTFHFHSLLSLTPFVMWLMGYLHSNCYISPSRPTWNTITWLPCDCTEPTHQTLRARLTPENPVWMSYYVTMHDTSCSFDLH